MTIALVTGATSGIGMETARLLVEAGVDTIAAGRDAERTRSAAAAIGARPLVLDVTDERSITAAVAAMPELDALVNNAGTQPTRADLPGTTVEDLRSTFETNVFGVVAVTNAFLPALRRSAHPRVVNVSSGTGSLAWTTGPNPQFDHTRVHGATGAYRASKTALNAVTVLTAQALEGSGVLVNATAPGLRRTNLAPGMSSGGDPVEAAEGVVRLALLPDDGPTGGFFSWDGSVVPW